MFVIIFASLPSVSLLLLQLPYVVRC